MKKPQPLKLSGGTASLSSALGLKPTAPSAPIPHGNRVRDVLQTSRSGLQSLIQQGAEQAAAVERCRAEEARRKIEEMFQEKLNIEECKYLGEFRLRLALILDFTASTLHDIQNLIRETRTLLSLLEKEFPKGVAMLPIAVRGNGVDRHERIVGKENDASFFGTVENNSYGWQSPVGHGLAEAVRRNFFHELERTVIQAAVLVGDDRFEGENHYEYVIPTLHRKRVAVASLLTPPGYYGDAYDSHVEAIVNPLGEKGIVITRGERGRELSAIDMIAQFILNQRENIARAMAAEVIVKEAPTPQSAALAVRAVSLGDFLRRGGYSSSAGSVTQGRRKALPGS